MKRMTAAVIALALACAAGGGTYYQFIYRQNAVDGRVSSESADAVPMDSVSMVAGLGSGTGVVERFSGVVEPQETWGAKIEGERTVKETKVKQGDYVKVGDVLFVYDTAKDEDTLAQNEIEIERSKSTIETNKAALAQQEKDKAKASADEQLQYTTEILTLQNEIKQEEYDIKEKERENEQLRATIAASEVTSELEGVVKSIKSQDSSGSSTDEESENYITIMDVGSYRVRGSVNEQHINRISEEEPMVVYSRVDASQHWTGTITEIKREAGEGNQNDMYSFYDTSGGDSTGSTTTYPFYVRLDSSEGLMLGQHVYMEADVGQLSSKSGIWIPENYLTKEEDETVWVWAASEKNTAEKRFVTLGEYDEDEATYEIISGLTADDYIHVPEDTIVEGAPVRYNEYGEDYTGEEDYSGIDEFGSFYYDADEFGSYYFDEDELGSYYFDEDEFGSFYYEEDELSGMGDGDGMEEYDEDPDDLLAEVVDGIG